MTEILMSNAVTSADSGVGRTLDLDLRIDMTLSPIMEALEEWRRQGRSEPVPEWFLRLHSGDLSVVGGSIRPGAGWDELNQRFGQEPDD